MGYQHLINEHKLYDNKPSWTSEFDKEVRAEQYRFRVSRRNDMLEDKATENTRLADELNNTTINLQIMEQACNDLKQALNTACMYAGVENPRELLLWIKEQPASAYTKAQNAKAE